MHMKHMQLQLDRQDQLSYQSARSVLKLQTSRRLIQVRSEKELPLEKLALLKLLAMLAQLGLPQLKLAKFQRR